MRGYVAHITVNCVPVRDEIIKSLPGTIVALHLCGTGDRGFTEGWFGIDAESAEEANVEAWRLAEEWRRGLDAAKADVDVIGEPQPVGEWMARSRRPREASRPGALLRLHGETITAANGCVEPVTASLLAKPVLETPRRLLQPIIRSQDAADRS